MTTVRLFDLSHNALTDAIAAEPLRKLLANNASLTALLLRSNDLTVGTAKALLSHVPANRTLLELDTSDNVDLRWPGQASEYAKLFKENHTLTAFGASLRPEALTAVLHSFRSTPARMRRLHLTMMPLGEEHIQSLCSWLNNKQVRAAIPRTPLPSPRGAHRNARRPRASLPDVYLSRRASFADGIFATSESQPHCTRVPAPF